MPIRSASRKHVEESREGLDQPCLAMAGPQPWLHHLKPGKELEKVQPRRTATEAVSGHAPKHPIVGYAERAIVGHRRPGGWHPLTHDDPGYHGLHTVRTIAEPPRGSTSLMGAPSPAVKNRWPSWRGSRAKARSLASVVLHGHAHAPSDDHGQFPPTAAHEGWAVDDPSRPRARSATWSGEYVARIRPLAASRQVSGHIAAVCGTVGFSSRNAQRPRDDAIWMLPGVLFYGDVAKDDLRTWPLFDRLRGMAEFDRLATSDASPRDTDQH